MAIGTPPKQAGAGLAEVRNVKATHKDDRIGFLQSTALLRN